MKTRSRNKLQDRHREPKHRSFTNRCETRFRLEISLCSSATFGLNDVVKKEMMCFFCGLPICGLDFQFVDEKALSPICGLDLAQLLGGKSASITVQDS